MIYRLIVGSRQLCRAPAGSGATPRDAADLVPPLLFSYRRRELKDTENWLFIFPTSLEKTEEFLVK